MKRAIALVKCEENKIPLVRRALNALARDEGDIEFDEILGRYDFLVRLKGDDELLVLKFFSLKNINGIKEVVELLPR